MSLFFSAFLGRRRDALVCLQLGHFRTPTVAVGMALSGHPPHRSVREPLLIRLLPWVMAVGNAALDKGVGFGLSGTSG